MEGWDAVLIAGFILAFALVSRRIRGTPITAPIVFVGFGFLVGPRGLDWIDLPTSSELIHWLAKLTLVLILFTDASGIRLRALERERVLPLRLLGIGLPLTLAVGFGVAALLFGDLELWEAGILAVILAPTDAALGQAVVTNEKVPGRIRQSLNVESGLNDGICVPILAVCTAGAAAAESAEAMQASDYWIRFGLESIGYGVLSGVVVGLFAVRLVDWSIRAGWMSHGWQRLSMIGIPLLAFTIAEATGGSGFIASFVAGLSVGHTTRHIKGHVMEFAEDAGDLLSLFTWLIFGGVLVTVAIDHFTWQVALYAVLSLTVVRMAPVAVALLGMRLNRTTVAFLGWFGPRGLASIVFTMELIQNDAVAGRSTIAQVVTWTVLLSVIIHGVTAAAGANWYARKMQPTTVDAGDGGGDPERQR
jgi:NhaP-type Na+/H+ or K+/H+ antiporter